MKRVLYVCASLLSLSALSVPLLMAADKDPESNGKIYDLKALSVTISEPVLLAKSKEGNWLCHPRLAWLANGEIVATIWQGGGEGKQGFSFSRDQGATWSEPEFIARPPGYLSVRLPSGDFAFLGSTLSSKPGGMSGGYYLIPNGTREIKWLPEGVEITGLPRPAAVSKSNPGGAGFVLRGQTAKFREDLFLCTLYGRFADTARDSLLLAESANGLQWKIKSIITDAKDGMIPGMVEGANESAIIRLKDGQLLCIYRSGGPYGQVWSSDIGKSWPRPERAACDGNVQPALALLRDGSLALATGRRLGLSFNLDGTGKAWQDVSIKDHHKGYHPEEKESAEEQPNGGTSGYPHLLPLDDMHLLYAYDRCLTTGTSVWIVRVDIVKRQ